MAISLGDAILYLKADASQLNTALGQVKSNIDRELGNILDASRQIGIGLTAVGAAITAPLIIASNQFDTFNKVMREVNSLVNVSEEAFDSMSQSVRNLAVKLGVDATEAGRGLYEIFSAITGISPADSLFLLEVAAKAAVAGVTSTKVAVDGLTTILNAWKLETSEATSVADQMFVAVKLGKVRFDEISRSIAVAAPMAASLGIPLKDVLATLVTITKQGTPAAEAFTEIRAFMVALQRPTTDLKQAFELLGVATGAELIQQRGLQGSMEALRKVSEDTGMTLIKMTGRVEGTQAILQTTGQNARGAQEDLKALGETAGATAQALEEIQKARGLDFLKAQAEELGLAVGKALRPALAGAAEELAGLLTTVSNFVKENPNFSAALLTAAAGFGAIALAVGPLLIFLPNIIESFGIISAGAITLTGATTGLGAAMTVLGGVAAIVAGAWLGWEIGRMIGEIELFGTSIDKLTESMFKNTLFAGKWGEANAANEASTRRIEGLLKTPVVREAGEDWAHYTDRVMAAARAEGLIATATAASTAKKKTAAETAAEHKKRLDDEKEAAEEAEKAYKALATTMGVTLVPSVKELTAQGAKLISQMKAHKESAQAIAVAQLNINDKIEKAKVLQMSYTEAFLHWRDATGVKALGSENAYTLSLDYLHMMTKAIDTFKAKSFVLMEFLNQPPPLLLNETNLFGPERFIVDKVLESKMKAAAEINDIFKQPLSIPAPDKQKFEETFHSMGEIARRQVSTIVTDFSKGFADILFSGDDWGDKFVNLFKKIGEGIVRAWIESGVVALLSGKGFSGFSGFFDGLTKAIGGGGKGGETGLLGGIGGLGTTIAGTGLGAGLLGNKLGGGIGGGISGGAIGLLGAELASNAMAASAAGMGAMTGITTALAAIPVWGWIALGAAVAAGPIISHFTRRGREKETATAAVEELGKQVWGPGGIIEAAQKGTITAAQATTAVDNLWAEYVLFLNENLEDQTVITRSIESQKHVIDDARAAIEGIASGTKNAEVQKQVEAFMADLTKTGVMSAAFSQLITDAGMSVDQFMIQADVARLEELQSGFAGLREELVALQPVQEDAFQTFLSTGQITDDLRLKIQEYGDTFANAREGTFAAAQALAAFNEYAKATGELEAFQSGGLAGILEGLNALAPGTNDPIEFFFKFHEITGELEDQINHFGLSLVQFQEFADLAGMRDRFNELTQSFSGTAQQIIDLTPMFEQFGGNLAVLNMQAQLPGLVEQKNQIGEWMTEIERFLPHLDKLKTSQKEMMENFFKTGQVSKEMMDWVTGAGGTVKPFEDFGAAKSLLDTFTRLRAEFSATKNETLGIADFVHQFGGAAANAALAGGAKLSDVLNLVETHLKENMTTQAGLIATELGAMKTGVELAIFNLQDAMTKELGQVAIKMEEAYQLSRAALVESITTLQTALTDSVTTTRGALIGMLTAMDLSLNASIQNFQNSLVMAINNLVRVLSNQQPVAGTTPPPAPAPGTTPPPPSEPPPDPTGVTSGLRGDRAAVEGVYSGFSSLYATEDPQYATAQEGYNFTAGAYDPSYYSPYVPEEPTYGTIQDAGGATSTSSLESGTDSGGVVIQQTNVFNRDTSAIEERRMLLRVNDDLVNQLAAYA